MSNNILKNNSQHIILFLPFVLVFIIEYITPMQSDDFVYHIKGNSLSVHLEHYFSWSGRFISDYFSTLILTSDSQLLKSTAISIILTCILFFIVKIGDSITNSNNSFFYLKFITIFFIYWITSPNIGQIVFWIVGASNYLITNLFISIYLYLLIGYIKNKDKLLPLVFISFFAGCSNENTTWIILLISLVTSSYLYLKEKNKIVFISTLMVLLGFSILIFSSGNFHRAELATEFYNLTLLGKLWLFLSDKLPYALSKTWIPISVSLLLLSTFISNKKDKIFYLSLFFISLGFLSTFSMVLSPSFPTRALSGSHFFYMISSSISISHILNVKKIRSLIVFYIIFILGFSSFLFSYSQIFFSYHSVKNQEIIRNYEILKDIKTMSKIDSIPKFYYPKSLRAGDSIDLYHDADATGKYYKLPHPINVYPIEYNYSVLIDGKKIPLANSETTGATNAYIGKSSLFKGFSIAIQFDNAKNFNNKNTVNVVTRSGKVYEYRNLNINSIYGMNILGFNTPVPPKEIDFISYQSDNGHKFVINFN